MINLEELSQLLDEEMKDSGIKKIPAETYIDVTSIISSLKRNYKGRGDDVSSRLSSALADLLSTMSSRLIHVRMGKMMRHDADLLKVTNLTAEEKYVLESLSDALKRMECICEAVTEGRSTVLDSIASFILSRRKIVTFLKPNAEFIGTDLKKYGPFKNEDVASIPEQNAVLLESQGVVKEIYVLK